MKITNSENIKIGYWIAECCEDDLHQIATENDLTEAQEIATRGYLYNGCWETKEEAAVELATQEWPFDTVRYFKKVDEIVGLDNTVAQELSLETYDRVVEKPEHRSDNCWCGQLPAVIRERIHLIRRE